MTDPFGLLRPPREVAMPLAFRAGDAAASPVSADGKERVGG